VIRCQNQIECLLNRTKSSQMRCISHFHTMLYRHHCSFFLVKILPQVTKGNEEGKLIYQPICYGMIPDKFSLPKLKRRRREAAKCHEDIKEMLMSIWTNLWQIYDKFMTNLWQIYSEILMQCNLHLHKSLKMVDSLLPLSSSVQRAINSKHCYTSSPC